ncbi:MAG: phosphoribosylformylglycinamidine cyclo-ligase [Actinomycetota bacterium]
MSGRAYDESGVGGQGEALSAILRHLQPTLSFPEGVESLTGFGHYASVLKIAPELALAITTDGVGSKTLIASAMKRYDTIGFDCIAMNVNDIICVGARPIAMVDYLGVNTLDRSTTEEILRGLAAAAKEAGVAIPGGELAQLPEVIGGTSSLTNLQSVQPDREAFDLVGACVGLMHPTDLCLGDQVRPGDAIVGFASSGIHSNGLTLARRVLLQDAGYSLDDEIPNLNASLGDELLRPTEIYVNAIAALRAANVDMHGMVHITGDGFANLCRLESDVTYELTDLPPTHAIFELIQNAGSVSHAEMYRVFNMGTGFIAVVTEDSARTAVEAAEARGYHAQRIGRVLDGARRVVIEQIGLVGTLEGGESSFEQV